MSDVPISRRCTNCGASIRRSGSFCPQCGARVEAARSSELKKPEAVRKTTRLEKKSGPVSGAVPVEPKAAAAPPSNPSPPTETPYVVSPAGSFDTTVGLKPRTAEPVSRGAAQEKIVREEHVTRSSPIIRNEAPVDTSLRFIIVAVALFLVALILVIISQRMR